MARQRLRDAGIPDDEAGLDARLLAQLVLGWDAARFLTASDQPPPPDFAVRFGVLVARRVAREPVAYITGRQEFWDLTFEVSPAVLIPRPETEFIVETALEWFPGRDCQLSICDVCTGSGCLAVALAHERPLAAIVATDVSAHALEVARRNAEHHGVATRMRFVQSDLLQQVDARFDLIVSNPPYVPERDWPTLQPEVRDYEPAIALLAGEDGITVIRRLLAQSVAALNPRGVLMFEFGFGQAPVVAELISNTAGLTIVGLKRDLQGIARTAIVQRSS